MTYSVPAAAIILMLVSNTVARADDMCAKDEASDVCALKEQRDYAMDASAHYEGALKDASAAEARERAKSASLRVYWRDYVSGVADGEKIKTACRWHGIMPKPLADLCKGLR